MKLQTLSYFFKIPKFIKIVVSFFIMILLPNVAVFGQDMGVASFKHLSDDLDARVFHPRTDQNGDICAIIKVVTQEKSFSFEGDLNGIVASVNKTGEYWVYVPYGSKSISVMHDRLGVLRKYNYPIPIEEANVYELRLITGRVETYVIEDYPTEWIVITSKPSGASIFIDNQSKGLTPFQQELLEGTYEFRLEYPMYHNSAGKIEVSREKGKQQLHFDLDPNFGKISVRSNPEVAASVFLDGRPSETTTPCVLEKVSSENHTISLSHYWYEPISRQVQVKDDQTVEVIIDVQPNFGNVKVYAEDEAQIYVDNELKTRGSWEGRLQSGIHTFEARKQNFYSDQTKVNIEAGKEKVISLHVNPKYGKLKIISEPFDATIKINGEVIGTTPMTTENMLIGEYSLTLEKANYAKVTKTVRVLERETVQFNETLTLGKPVRISTDATGAKLIVDGIDYGSTPATVSLTQGSHTIKLSHGNISKTEYVVVRESTTNLSFKLYDCYSNMRINSYPPGAKIAIDGKYIGMTPDSYLLTKEQASLSLSKPGYNLYTNEIDCGTGDLNPSLHKKPSLITRYYDFSGESFIYVLNGSFYGSQEQIYGGSFGVFDFRYQRFYFNLLNLEFYDKTNMDEELIGFYKPEMGILQPLTEKWGMLFTAGLLVDISGVTDEYGYTTFDKFGGRITTPSVGITFRRNFQDVNPLALDLKFEYSEFNGFTFGVKVLLGDAVFFLSKGQQKQ